MEWLISASLSNALGIGAATYALAQLGFADWASRLAQNLKRVQELTDKNEQVELLNKTLEAERDQLQEVLVDTKRERAKLKEQRDELRAGHRQARIERWRSVIVDFDFHTENFASTDTYYDMEPELRPEVVAMFKQRTFRVPNEAYGDSAYRTALLREVVRIEREWGLI
jgi:predicted nuclease with TOPRIM domain